MDNIEQLKQDNAKLTERLNNAAKFFREQKAQIESLTKENEELKSKYKEQENFESNTINKVVPELEEKVKALQTENEQILKKYEARKEQHVELLGKIEQLEHDAESFNNLQEGYEKEIENLKKSNALQDEEIAQLKKESTKRISEYQAQIEDLKIAAKNEIDKRLADYGMLQRSYEDLNDKYKLAQKESTNSQELSKQLDEKNKFISEVQEKIKDYIKQIAELKESLEKKVEQVKAVEKTTDGIIKNKDVIITELQANVKVLEDKHQKLSEMYSQLENEKLSFENDYTNIKSKYETIKLERENDEGIIQGLQQEIAELEKSSLKKEDVLKMIMNLRDTVGFNFESVIERLTGKSNEQNKASGTVKAETITSKPEPVKQFQYTSKDNTIKM